MYLGETVSKQRMRANFPYMSPILWTFSISAVLLKSVFFWSDQSLVKYLGLSFLVGIGLLETLKHAFNKDYNEIVSDSFKLRAYALSFYLLAIIGSITLGVFWQFLLYRIFK